MGTTGGSVTLAGQIANGRGRVPLFENRLRVYPWHRSCVGRRDQHEPRIVSPRLGNTSRATARVDDHAERAAIASVRVTRQGRPLEGGLVRRVFHPGGWRSILGDRSIVAAHDVNMSAPLPTERGEAHEEEQRHHGADPSDDHEDDANRGMATALVVVATATVECVSAVVERLGLRVAHASAGWVLVGPERTTDLQPRLRSAGPSGCR